MTALANAELGLLDQAKAAAIVRACEEIREGALVEEFVVDVIQGGAGCQKIPQFQLYCTCYRLPDPQIRSAR